MGHQNQGYALVSMSNGDVYYVSIDAAKEIKGQLTREPSITFIEAVDIKQHTRVTINVALVSSLVIKDSQDA